MERATPTDETSSLHPTAVIARGAAFGAGLKVGPYVVVEDGVMVGARCEIRAHAVLKRGTTLGDANVVHEHAVLGGEPQHLAFAGEATGLVIGRGNRIREGVTIHRGLTAASATVVGDDCFLMAYAHVAHDNRIGNGVILANNVMLAGHVEIGDRAFLGGGAGVHQFSRVGRLAMVGGNAKIIRDCLPFVITDGAPGRACGLNLVGLRRAGFTAAQIRALKEGYRLLLRAALPLEQALAKMTDLQDPLVDELVAFARSTKRGFARAGGEPDPE